VIFDEFFKELKSGRLTLNKTKIREDGRYDGKYVLLTKEMRMDASELALQYKNLFSYFIQRYAELKTGQCWDTIQRHLGRIVATKILLKNGSIVKRSQLTNFQKSLLNQLDIKEPPLILET